MDPIIGITVDNLNNTAASGRYDCGIGYSRAVARFGGTPVLLPHEIDRVEHNIALCHGFIFTGGVDPDTRAFGQPVHPNARVMDPQRQAFELAMLERLRNDRPSAPCLGICLGMQLMALHAGGRLNQYLPDTLGEAAAGHSGHQPHGITLEPHAAGKIITDTQLQAGEDLSVSSHHQQAVADAGAMRVIATAPDGVIEAIDDPQRRWYVGVQWHPERGEDGPLNQRLLQLFVAAAREAM